MGSQTKSALAGTVKMGQGGSYTVTSQVTPQATPGHISGHTKLHTSYYTGHSARAKPGNGSIVASNSRSHVTQEVTVPYMSVCLAAVQVVAHNVSLRIRIPVSRANRGAPGGVLDLCRMHR